MSKCVQLPFCGIFLICSVMLIHPLRISVKPQLIQLKQARCLRTPTHSTVAKLQPYCTLHNIEAKFRSEGSAEMFVVTEPLGLNFDILSPGLLIPNEVWSGAGGFGCLEQEGTVMK